jgi:thiol-disulfide isomerase/thioredoxin
MAKHIIFFYADWCGHCERMQEPWNKFVASHKSDKLITTEKIESEKIPSKYSSIVNGFPCFAVFVNDKLFKKLEGEQDNLEELLTPAPAGGKRRSGSRGGLTRRVRGRKTLRSRRR